MPLEKNQIRSAFFWVHPSNQPVGDAVIAKWEGVIRDLALEPRIALLEIPQTGGKAHYSLDKRGDELVDRMHEKIGELEILAEATLGDRFRIWPHGNFVDGDNQDHRRTLQEIFHLTERELVPGWPEALLIKIYCYGLKPSVCVYTQAYRSSLDKISYIVDHNEASPYPNGMVNFKIYIPKTKAGPGYHEGIPSTQESFDYFASQGRLNFLSEKMRNRLRKSLPAISAQSARSIVHDTLRIPWAEHSPHYKF